MFTRLLRTGLPAILATTIAIPVAEADIYTWTDANGSVNVSNLAPPDGVHLTSVVRESDPKRPTAGDQARDATREAAREALRDAEVQALATRVRQLQDEVDQATRQPPVVAYRDLPVQPPPQYALAQYGAAQYEGDWAQPYDAYAGSQGNYPCNFNCGVSWLSPIVVPTVFFLRSPNSRRYYPAPSHPRYFYPPQRPMHVPANVHRGY